MAKDTDKPKTVPCGACNGTGGVAWGDGTVVCGGCGGKGTVKA